MRLNKLILKDKIIFDKYLTFTAHELAAYSFANIYIWKALYDIRWGVIGDNLCIFFQDKIGCFMYLAPLTKEKNPYVLEEAFAIMDSFNQNKDISRIENIPQADLEYYRVLGYLCHKKYPDYLCLRKDLALLGGNKLKSQRASCNHFIKHYNFDARGMKPADKEDCLNLFNSWLEQRKRQSNEGLLRNSFFCHPRESGDPEPLDSIAVIDSRFHRNDDFRPFHNSLNDDIYCGMLEDNRKVIKEALVDYKRLGFEGIAVKVDKEIKGFSFGYKLNKDTFCILYEITDLSVKGLAQFIFRYFCQGLKDYKYINIMDDSGLENLRRVKLSYKPARLIPAYIVTRDA